tara:strand:+ start:3199 stop:5289 length:2091 start_codon:yes stop_codon:yes gene_type:complete
MPTSVNLSPALSPLLAYRQFILYKLVPSKIEGKKDKLPVNPHTKEVCNAHDRAAWLDYDTVAGLELGNDYGIAFVFTHEDPFFFLDIDNCQNDDGSWKEIATELCTRLSGAAVEVSQSGKGLHIFGTTTPVQHGCKNKENKLELYSADRFVALTDLNTIGNAATDCTEALQKIIDDYFTKSEQNVIGWRDTHVDEANPIVSDDELIAKAMNAKSAGSVFGNKASFKDLWTNNESQLHLAYPSFKEEDPYDRSAADAALAQMLAFWTGKNHARIWNIMWQSQLVRDKWHPDNHKHYLTNTVINSVNNQVNVYGSKSVSQQSLATPILDPTDITTTSVLNKLRDLSVTRRIVEMEKNLQNDVYIFEGMALKGQITLFFAKPGTGKTLLFMHFIIDSIIKGTIKNSNLFYINADDSYKGLFTKGKMAEKHGFEMISPAESGISPGDILNMLDELSNTDDASEIIIILDTLKKFTDLMNKKNQSDFYNVLRKLVAKNATVIIAGHTNKYPDEEGNLIYEGTSDTMNDIDCAYSINLMTPSEGDVVVEFRRVKSRGDVVSTVSYGYKRVIGMSYYDIVDSVCKLNEQASSLVSEQNKIQEKLNKYESEKLFVQRILNNGPLIQSEIVKIYMLNSKDANEVHHGLACEFSKSSLLRALPLLTNIAWTATRNRDNNALTYEFLNSSLVEIQEPINNVLQPGVI